MQQKHAIAKRYVTLIFVTLLIAVLVATPVLAATTTTPIYAAKWGTAGSGSGQLLAPLGIDADSSKVYVADTDNNRIQIFNHAGSPDSIIGPTFDNYGIPDTLIKPRGVAVDTSGNIYISDTGHGRIVVFDAARTFLMEAGETGTADPGTGLVQFVNPGGLAVDSAGGFLYVADTDNNRVTRLNLIDLTPLGTALGSGLSGPKDLAVDASGANIYVADTGNNRLVKIPTGGGAQTASSGLGLNQPSGIAIDASNYLYVADTGNNRLMKMTNAFASSITWGSAGDATTSGKFNAPSGVTVSGVDMVYVADKGNNRIQYFEPNQPMTNITLSKSDITEGNTVNQTIGTFATTDPNQYDTFNYNFTTITGQACDNGTYFNLSGANLTAKYVYDYEARSSYSVCIKVTDSNSLNSLSLPFTISINDTLDAPAITGSTTYSMSEYTSASNNSISPNYKLNPVITVLDNDTNDDMTFSITGGSFANAFNVVKVVGSKNTANLVVKDNGANPPAYQTLLDYETAPGHAGTVTVLVTDSDVSGGGKNYTPGDHNTTTATFTINLNPINDPPVFSVPLTPYAVNENTGSGIQVGDTITLTDQDTPGSLHTLTIDPAYPNPSFTVTRVSYTGNTSIWKIVTTSTPLDYETTPAVDLHLRAWDNTIAANYVYTTVHITVNNLDEPPALKTGYNIGERASNGMAVNLATDPEGAPLTYTIESGNTGNTFGIDSNGQLVVSDNTLLDLSKWQGVTPPHFQLGITVTDGTTSVVTGTVPVTIVYTNWQPVFTTNPAPVLSVPENESDNAFEVGRISATDKEGDQLTFSTNTGDPGNPFKVNPSATPGEAVVTVDTNRVSLLDYEVRKYYDLAVTVSDGTSASVTQTFRVTITNVNEPITITNKNLALTKGDRTAANTVIGQIQWTDVDGVNNTQPTFNLSGDGENQFGINPDTGAIYILPTATLHYYLQSVYYPTIGVADKSGTDATHDSTTISITLTDDNDPPTFRNASFHLNENSANNTVVGTFEVFDENDNPFTLDVSGGSCSPAFCINPKSQYTDNSIGKLVTVVEVTVKDSTKLDYETAPNHQLPLTIQGTDTLTASRSYTYNIALDNVNEAPSLSNQAFLIYQNAPGGSLVGTITASDPDAGTVFTFVPVPGGTGDSLLDLNTSNGKITVGAGKILSPGTLTLLVKVKDNGSPQLDSGTPATMTITVTAKADPAVKTVTASAPQILTGSPFHYDIVTSNEASGVSSTYKLQIKLPYGVSYVIPGSTSGCVMKTADTVECPGQILAPQGTNGDTAAFVINAYVQGGLGDNRALTTTATLVPDDLINDGPNTANNTRSVTFTAMKDIAITNQVFDTGAPESLSLNSVPLGSGALTTTPACAKTPQKFLGLFKNDQLTLTKNGLLPHNKVEIFFDLYLPYSWDGVNPTYGPDRWKFCLGNCQSPADMLLDTTFSNQPEPNSSSTVWHFPQTFPDSFSSGLRHPAQAGAAQVNTLGYTEGGCSEVQDSIYNMHFTLNDHTDPNLVLNFIGEGLEAGAYQEQWGIDNLRILIYGENGFDTFLPLIKR